jgi:ATP-binding cassette, subfamily B, bacterial PglK
MQKLTFRSIGKILDKKARRKLLLLSIARIAANLLDLIGLAGIALLATSFSYLASGAATRSPLSIPGVGEILITELQAVLIAMVIAGVFLMKSGFSIWLNLLTSLTVAGFEGKFSRELAEDFFSPIQDSDIGSDSVAEFQNRVLYSSNAISTFLNARMTFVAEGSLLIAMIAIFIAVNPIATASMGLFMGGVLFTLNKMIGFRIARNGQLQMKGYETSLETSRDLFGVKREALSSGVTPNWLSKFSKGRTQAAQGYALIYTLSSLPRYVVETSLVMGIFAFIGGIVVFSDIQTQAVTIGVFMAGGLRLIASLLPLQAAFNQMQDGSTRGQLAFNALVERRTRQANDVAPGDLSIPENPEVVFNNVEFRYPKSDAQVLAGISFSVEPLTKVAIVGPSGAGKSTIFDLATGFREPTGGSITVGGANPRDILFGAPGTFGIVTQRPHLVTGSILENVSLVEDSSTDLDKVHQSLVRAGLKKFTQVENWFELQIKPDSGQLSGGEIQRLGLARALYSDPKILFLDEATSALDAETEAEITKVLNSLKNEMTVILIAHRLSTVQQAENIIYLKEGRIEAQGTFAQLQKEVPEFAQAVKLMHLAMLKDS